MKERIIKIRKTFKLTQEKFAERLGIPRASIAKIETGSNLPTLDIVNNIHNEFNVNLNWLISGVGDPFVSENNITTNAVAEPRANYSTKNNIDTTGLPDYIKSEIDAKNIIIRTLADKIKQLEDEADIARQRDLNFRKPLTKEQYNYLRNKGTPKHLPHKITPK